MQVWMQGFFAGFVVCAFAIVAVLCVAAWLTDVKSFDQIGR